MTSFLRVDARVYTSGQEPECAGVIWETTWMESGSREVREADQVEAILKRRSWMRQLQAGQAHGERT